MESVAVWGGVGVLSSSSLVDGNELSNSTLLLVEKVCKEDVPKPSTVVLALLRPVTGLTSLQLFLLGLTSTSGKGKCLGDSCGSMTGAVARIGANCAADNINGLGK